MDLEIEHGGPDLEVEEDEGDGGCLGISVSLNEVDGTWHNVSTMVPVDNLTPDAIAGAMISSMVGLAAARGPATLIALQQRLMTWGQET